MATFTILKEPFSLSQSTDGTYNTTLHPFMHERKKSAQYYLTQIAVFDLFFPGNSKMADAIWASLLSSAPFSVHNPLTSDVLLPWYPLGSTCGVPSSTVEHLKE